MIDTDMINLWAWDARPFPDFPARDSVWSDGENWQRGHWLPGRMGLVPLSDVVEDICIQSGLEDVDVSKLTGLVQGYRIDRPMTGRAAMTPLSLIYEFNAVETAKGLRFSSVGTEINLSLKVDDIAGDLSASIEQIKATPEDCLRDTRIHFIDAGNDYQLGLSSARDRAAETVRILDINAPIVMDRSFAKLTADRLLARQIDGATIVNFQLSETRLDIEVGDLMSLPHIDEIWQVETLEGLTTQRVQARRVGERSLLPNAGATPEISSSPQWAAKPALFALDLPGDYQGPLIGVGLDPFAITDVSAGDESLTLGSPARIGALLTALPSGPVGRWDMANIMDIFLPSAALSSISDDAVYAGGNRFAVETTTGWEIFQAGNAELIAPSTYRLSRLLRGQDGSDADMQDVIAPGARVVWLGAGWDDLSVPNSLIGESIPINAIAAGRQSDTLHHTYKAVHLRPLSPVHVKMTEENGQITLSWIRRTRIGGDSWAGLDVPLGEEIEAYSVQLWAEGAVIAEYETTEPKLTLSTLQNADTVTIAQTSRAFGWGEAETLFL